MWPTRAHRRAATAPACLSSPSTPGRPERRHALPRTVLTLPRPPPLPLLSLPLTRSTAAAAARHRRAPRRPLAPP